MKLFKLKKSVDASVIGVFPQVGERWPWPTDRWGADSYTMTPLKGYIEFKIIFPYFELEKGAKLTDWVSTVNVDRNYLMVSTKLVDLLHTFILDEKQDFPALVHTPEGITKYHLVYFPWPRQDDFIDWKKSVFEKNPEDGAFGIQFEDSRNYLMQHNENTKIKDIVIFPERITCDVFRFTNYQSGFYVSERLKNAMETAGMTGIEYEVPEWLPK